MEPLRLCLWSGPRNVSTPILYAFAQRADTRVVDEPLYAHYLRVSGADHPGREDVIAAQGTGEEVVRDIILGPCDRPVLFMKHMAHHLVELDRGFLERTTNFFLIRDPSETLRTLSVQLGRPGLADTGLAVQSALLTSLREAGQDPCVLEARALLDDPRGVLTELCSRLGLEFDEAMLGWTAGARPEDGVWAPHWYQNVHRSTGFGPHRPKVGPFPSELEDALAECQPHYELLLADAIGT